MIKKIKTKFNLIIITGTPGTGKKFLALKLAKKLGYNRIDLSKYYKNIAISHSKKCYNIDLNKFISLIKSFKGDLILDSHIAHLLPKEMVSLCIVKILDLKKLKFKLEEKGYGIRKVRENLDSEIFQVCLNEAFENGHDVVIIEKVKELDYIF